MLIKLKITGNPKLIDEFLLFLGEKYQVYDIARIDDILNMQVVFVTVFSKE